MWCIILVVWVYSKVSYLGVDPVDPLVQEAFWLESWSILTGSFQHGGAAVLDRPLQLLHQIEPEPLNEFCNSTLWSRCWTTATDSFGSERAAVLWLLNENEPVFSIVCKRDKKNFFAFSQVSQLLWSVRCRRQIRAHNTISGLHSWKHRERIKKNKAMQSVPALFSGHLCELWKMTNYDWNNV